MEGFVIVLGASIYDGDTFNKLIERDTSSIVPYGTFLAIEGHYDLTSIPFHEFIDRVVDDLLKENVDSIFRMGSVSQPSYVHSRTLSYVFNA